MVEEYAGGGGILGAIIIETFSGSIYEIDEENKRVRKNGLTSTEMLSPGDWKQYKDVHVIDGCLLFMWDHPGEEFGNRSTITSPVKRIPEFKN